MSHKIEEGFSIMEILVAMLITTFSVGAIMHGVITLRETTNEFTMKEKAFDELANYTELWKSKIAAGQWSGGNSWNNAPEFTLAAQPNAIKATLSKKGGIINGDYPYPLYSLETKITWNDHPSGDVNELNLKVFQLEFK